MGVAGRPIQNIFRQRFAVQSVLVILLIGVIGASAFATHRAERRSMEADDILRDLVALQAEIIDAETGLRGYYIVGQAEFLEPYRRTGATFHDDVASLAERLGDDARLARIHELAVEWRDVFAEPVLADLANERREEATNRIASGAGKTRIDEIRSLSNALAADVRAEVDDSRRQIDILGVASTGATVAVALVLMVTGIVLKRRLDHALSQPLVDLATVTERLGSGDLRARTTRVDGVREVNVVAEAIDDMARRLEETVDELRALDRMKSEFVSLVSHELRTPLTSIRGSLGLVVSDVVGPVPDEAREMLQIAVTNTDRLVRLINDILDLERMDSGRMGFDPHHFPIADVLEEAASNVAGNADAAGVRIDVAAVDGTVYCDCDRIVQALTNLLGNAVKFSPAGSVVDLEATHLDDHIELRVRDHGRGIPPDQIENVFERFSQVDSTDARELGGTGLGLAIVEQIARQHGGHVTVESTGGEGSTFTLVLPATNPADAERPTTDGADAAATVLVAEEDVDLRQVARAQLARHGLRVEAASRAEEVIDRCREQRPDVLVLSIRLDGGTAFDVVAALREHDSTATIPTVVYTASPLDGDEVERLRLGETRVVTKAQRGAEKLEEAVLGMLSRDAPP
jgi:signal transduction histidine kinase